MSDKSINCKYNNKLKKMALFNSMFLLLFVTAVAALNEKIVKTSNDEYVVPRSLCSCDTFKLFPSTFYRNCSEWLSASSEPIIVNRFKEACGGDIFYPSIHATFQCFTDDDCKVKLSSQTSIMLWLIPTMEIAAVLLIVNILITPSNALYFHTKNNIIIFCHKYRHVLSVFSALLILFINSSIVYLALQQPTCSHGTTLQNYLICINVTIFTTYVCSFSVCVYFIKEHTD